MTAGKYRVVVRRDKCISAASCVALAPGTFELDDAQLVKIINQEGDEAEQQLLAAQSCPTMAIEIIDTTTGKKVWPLE